MKTPSALDVGVSSSKRCFRLKFRATFSAAQDNGRTRAACTRFSNGGTPKDLSPAKPIARSIRHRTIESNLAFDISINYTIKPLKRPPECLVGLNMPAPSASHGRHAVAPLPRDREPNPKETGNRMIAFVSGGGWQPQVAGGGRYNFGSQVSAIGDRVRVFRFRYRSRA